MIYMSDRNPAYRPDRLHCFMNTASNTSSGASSANPLSHIAVIMDGNGRWAEGRNLPRLEGHRAGVEAVRATVRAARELEIPYLTLYAFSEENWSRPEEEVRFLMTLLQHYLQSEMDEMLENGIRLSALGNLEKLPAANRKALEKTMAATSGGDRMTLNLALSYSGRDDILQAAKRLAEKCGPNPDALERITEQEFSELLSTGEMPDPDLLIRTSGESRISNFLLWQLAYTEIVITEKLWPDFRKEDLLAAIETYHQRERRFGKTGAQLGRPTATPSRPPSTGTG